MEQLINLFLTNLRAALDAKKINDPQMLYAKNPLTDSEFNTVITDMGRLSANELKTALTLIFTNPNWVDNIQFLEDAIVNNVTFDNNSIQMQTQLKGLLDAQVRRQSGDEPFDPNAEDRSSTPTEKDDDIPQGPFDPGAEDPSGGIIPKIDPKAITGDLPEGVTERAITAILKKYRDLQMPEEDRKLFRAWYAQLNKEIAGLFPDSVSVIGIDGQMKTITGAEAALWTAMIAADQKVTEGKSAIDPTTGGLVKPPPENSIKVTVMSQSVLADGTVSSVPQDVFIQLTPEQFQLLQSSAFINRLGEVGIAGDDSYPLISIFAGAWQDLKDALRNPSMLGIGEVDTAVMAEMFMKINGEVNKYNPINPRDEQLPSLSEELIRTGIAYAMDPVTKTMKLIDTMPWVGPSPASLTWIPQDPNNPTGVGSWSIDESMEMSIGKSLDEGVPTSVRPWLQAVLNAGGDLSVIDQAFPEDALNDDFAQKQIQIIRHWVGYIMGQARIASDPRYAKQPVSIPRGAGMPPIDINAFDVAYPGFAQSSHGWEDLGLDSRAAIIKEAAQTLGVGADWRERWNNAQSTGQIGSKERYGAYPNMYTDIDGDAAIAGQPIDTLDDILAKASNSITGTDSTTASATGDPRGDTYFDTTIGRWQGGWEGRDWGDTANDPWTTTDWRSIQDNSTEATNWKRWVSGLVSSRISAQAEIKRLLAEDPNAFIPEGLRKQAEGYITDSARAHGQKLYDAWQAMLIPEDEKETKEETKEETKPIIPEDDSDPDPDPDPDIISETLLTPDDTTDDASLAAIEAYEKATAPAAGTGRATGLSNLQRAAIIQKGKDIIASRAAQTAANKDKNAYNDILDKQFADYMGAGDDNATTTNTTGMSSAANTVNIGNTASAQAAAQKKKDDEAAAAAAQKKKDDEDLARILAMTGAAGDN